MNKHYILIIVLTGLLNAACVDMVEYNDSPRGNFEALWKIIDEKYCFFTYKQIDWNSVYDEYSQYISDDMSEEELFYMLNEMLQELRDGHVNLYSSFDVGRYWSWFENYPPNFNSSIVHNYYLKENHYESGGVKYRVMEDNIGYIYYEDFTSMLGEVDLDKIISRLSPCDGIILDVRENGGGLLTTSNAFAARFTDKKTLVGYIQHKTGKGHDDFSDPFPKYIEPSSKLKYLKTVVVLTNRKCYSATNDFVNAMGMFPNVTIIGDQTGGGSGLPFTSELPNGWSVRYSACPMLNVKKEHIEFGIDPDIKVNLSVEDVEEGKDTLIETARKIIKSKV